MAQISGALAERGRLSGALSAVGGLTGTLSPPQTLTGQLTVPTAVGVEIYGGPYEVTPQARREVVLETANRFLEQDVAV